MNLTQKLLAFTLLGAEWVLWLLIFLSVISLAIAIERGLYYFSLRADFGSLARSSAELHTIKDTWPATLGRLIVRTPNPAPNRILSV